MCLWCAYAKGASVPVATMMRKKNVRGKKRPATREVAGRRCSADNVHTACVGLQAPPDFACQRLGSLKLQWHGQRRSSGFDGGTMLQAWTVPGARTLK
jgi:hypothetical protein